MKKLALTAAVLAGALTANVSQACWFWEDCTYTKTKYPMVLAPGVLGFDKCNGQVKQDTILGSLSKKITFKC
jgi:triacylglycerol lipase